LQTYTQTTNFVYSFPDREHTSDSSK